MNKRLEIALEKIQSLSEERQAYAAVLLEQLADAGDEPYRLSEQECALVREGLRDIESGRIVSETEMDAFWNRH